MDQRDGVGSGVGQGCEGVGPTQPSKVCPTYHIVVMICGTLDLRVSKFINFVKKKKKKENYL